MGWLLLGRREVALHVPQALGSSGEVRKEARAYLHQHAPRESSSAHWVEIGAYRTCGGPKKLGGPFGSLIGGWPGWCWVHSEPGTARGVGRLSTVGRGEDTQVKAFVVKSRHVQGRMAALVVLPSSG